jgi:Cd2+/Zn2+-exporting ATPase
MVTLDLQDELTALGFTEYEAKVYLALLEENPSTGYQLSKLSGVPRSMVYDALKRLHSRGAALETIEGRATLYRPLPPKVLLDRHESEHRRLLQELRNGLNSIYVADSDDRVWTISGKPTVMAYARRMLEEAQSEIYLVLTDADLQTLQPHLLAAHRRGVPLNVLLTGEARLDFGRVAQHPPLESELQGLTAMVLVAVEGGEMLVASAAAHRAMTATVTHNPDLVFIARQFVWMELFTQRVYAQLGDDLLQRLPAEDRAIFESLKT